MALSYIEDKFLGVGIAIICGLLSAYFYSWLEHWFPWISPRGKDSAVIRRDKKIKRGLERELSETKSENARLKALLAQRDAKITWLTELIHHCARLLRQALGR